MPSQEPRRSTRSKVWNRDQDAPVPSPTGRGRGQDAPVPVPTGRGCGRGRRGGPGRGTLGIAGLGYFAGQTMSPMMNRN
eukprot:scaffold157724_cov21-Tisochrysis_lutea.AAC.1